MFSRGCLQLSLSLGKSPHQLQRAAQIGLVLRDVALDGNASIVPAALEGLGVEEYFYGKGICLVEWPERARGQLPPADLDIALEAWDTFTPSANAGVLVELTGLR